MHVTLWSILHSQAIKVLIKELVKQSSVSKDTIRYYEQINLISLPLRLANGYRNYSIDTVKQLKFIKMAQTVGFTLKQIKPAMAFVSNPKPNCPFLKEAINDQLNAIDEKIELLNLSKKKLINWLEKNRKLIGKK